MKPNTLPFFKKLFVLGIIGVLFFSSAFSQTPFSPKTSRILIILDASGSMGAKWRSEVKFNLAKEILFNITDSLYKSNKNIEFGLRVLGHQYPKVEKNCKDTKLEVPFGKNNSKQIRNALSNITPKGQTPIAYSLLQAANDFPTDSGANHSIILITDGIETCEGNACNAAKELSSKRISVKPFIVGLGISDSMKKFYDCVGTMYSVDDEGQFGSVINAVVKQALNKTTLQVNLLDKHEMPTVTNLEFTLVDHRTGAARYHYVHKLDTRGNPDTLYVDPKGIYDIIVHSIPSVKREEIELTPGKHNSIAIDMPQGILSLEPEGPRTGVEGVQCLVRQYGSPEIIYVQDAATQMSYLEGSYDLEILTLPRIQKTGVEIAEGKIASIKIPVSGTLNFTPTEIGVASIFLRKGEKMERVYDFHSVTSPVAIMLLPGDYTLMWRPDKGKQASKSKTADFVITSSKITGLKL